MMPVTKDKADSPAQKEIKYDKKLMTFIRLFKQDEIHQLAKDNDLLIDESKLDEGILKVLSFTTQKAVPTANLQRIKLFITGVDKKLKKRHIDISKVIETELAERDNIKQVGHKYSVLLDLEGNSLSFTGEQKPVTEAVNEVKTLLGLDTTPHLHVNGYRRPRSARDGKNGATGSSSGSKGNTGNSWTDGYPKLDAGVQGRQIGLTAMGSPRQPPAGGYTHVRSGVHVMATVTDITQMTVDAVVNAANHKLRHGGGVALAIARAAGQDLLRECNTYIRKKGHLDVSETFVSTAGRMPAEKVIHTVGPQWRHNNAQISMQLLGATFYNVLDTAERDELRTLAIPGISSGTFGMPLDLVAEIAVNSITQYLENTQKTVLTNIFLVGMDSSLISYIESHLDSYVQSGLYHSHSRPAASGKLNKNCKFYDDAGQR